MNMQQTVIDYDSLVPGLAWLYYCLPWVQFLGGAEQQAHRQCEKRKEKTTPLGVIQEKLMVNPSFPSQTV